MSLKLKKNYMLSSYVFMQKFFKLGAAIHDGLRDKQT